jgi:hypothetical protein
MAFPANLRTASPATMPTAFPVIFTQTCRVSVNSSKRSYFFVPTYEPKKRKARQSVIS